jgi:hypothetical protein
MTLVVNLVAGPGAGKSTTAADIFALLKKSDVNAELVREYAKDLSWIKDFKTLADQYYVTMTQQYRQYMVDGQVDVMTTDSPLIVGLLYYEEKNKKIKNLFTKLILEMYKSQDNMTFYIKRKKKYNPAGRNQDEKEAIQKDKDAKNLLDVYKIPYTIIDGNKRAAQVIVSKIKERLWAGTTV